MEDKSEEAGVKHDGDMRIDNAATADEIKSAAYNFHGRIVSVSIAMKEHITAGNAAAVETLLRDGADANNLDYLKPLNLAAEMGKLEIIQILLKNGADVNLGDDNGRTALMSATLSGHTDCVEYLISNGAKLELQNNLGMTALMVAAHYGRHSCLQKLLQFGSEYKDLQCKCQKSALVHALDLLNESCIHELAKSGADMNLKDRDGRTALMTLIIENSNSDRASRVLKILLEAGASVNVMDKYGVTPLMFAARFDKSVRYFDDLIDAGADVDATVPCGLTALTHAISEVNLEYVRRLFDIGANIDIKAALLHTNFYTMYRDFISMHVKLGLYNYMFKHHNCRILKLCNHDDMDKLIEFLINKGADVNVQDTSGMTPLMYAARESHTNRLSLLLRLGAQINMQDKVGRSALHHAFDYIYIHMKEKYVISLLETTPYRDEKNKNVRFLLKNGANPNIKSADGKSILSRSIYYEITFLEFIFNQIKEPLIDLVDFVHLVKDHDRRKLQLLVQYGTMLHPYNFNIINIDCKEVSLSIITTALEQHQLGTAKFLLATGYLTSCDTTPSQINFKTEPRRTVSRYSESELMEFQNDLYSQPWPLVKLSFVAVSSIMGASPGREKRVRESGLPDILQRMLLFQEPISKLCVNQWDSIPFCFNPSEYENLPMPRPYLLYWPIGRGLIPCGCDKCGHEGLKFA